MKFLLDTNAFKSALDLDLDLSKFSSRVTVFVTHQQVEAMLATKQSERLAALLAVLHKIDTIEISTSTVVRDVSTYGEVDFGDAGSVHSLLQDSLHAKNHNQKNNAQDALIGATALSRNMILVTDNDDLAMSLLELGGASIVFSDFVQAT